MIEEIRPGLFKTEIPLPKNPLKATNSYLIKSEGRNLIIDTGMNREECRSAMRAALTKLDVRLEETDLFITHLHADHLGLVADLATPFSKIYFNQPDADILVQSDIWEIMLNQAGANGFPEEELRNAIHQHPGYKYSPNEMVELVILKEGDRIKIGEYTFECVETPGHTHGHMCLYEPEKKILVSGDHILGDITPNISLWSDEENPLKDYLASLEKITQYEVELVLPGHRRIFTDCKGRIEELKHHHRLRVNEVISILNDGSKSAYEVASEMTWDIVSESWDSFPVSQKWFATGEALAHLKFLADQGRVSRETRDQKTIYSVN